MAHQPDEARPHSPDPGTLTPKDSAPVGTPSVNPGEPQSPSAPSPATIPHSDSGAPIQPDGMAPPGGEQPPLTQAETSSNASPEGPPTGETLPVDAASTPAAPSPAEEASALPQPSIDHEPHDVSDPAHSEYHHDEYHDHHAGEHQDPYHEHGSQHYDYPSQDHGSGGAPPTGVAYREEPSDLPPEEEGGGPVKSFLEHLEDFRWLLIKCTAGIAVTMVVCLLAVNQLVKVLEWPLKQAAKYSSDKRQMVVIKLGQQDLMKFRTETNHIPGLPLGTNLLTTNRYVELELVPFITGTNTVLTLRLRSTSEELPPGQAMRVVYLKPADPFINSLHLAFFGGMLIAAPFVFYHLAQFLLPALKPREKKYFIKALTPAVLLFVTGVCLCYFLILPLALRATEQYSLWMGVDMPFWEATAYFGFITKFMLGMGLGFEMPVLLLALVKIGLLDYKKLASWRRHMIVINLVLGALLTTPEVITQIAMFFPLQFLYEVTIWIAWYWEQENRPKARRRAALALLLFALTGVLIWLGVQYGWPWLRAHW